MDPFSSAIANARVQATHIYTMTDDGFSQPWICEALWMNHPFSREYNRRAVAKIDEEYTSGRMKQGCCITFAATSELWFQPLLRRAQCFLSPRTNYILPDGTLKRGVTKGSVITYYGPNVAAFAREFSALGVIKIPYQS